MSELSDALREFAEGGKRLHSADGDAQGVVSLADQAADALDQRDREIEELKRELDAARPRRIYPDNPDCTPEGEEKAAIAMAAIWQCPPKFARHHMVVDAENGRLQSDLTSLRARNAVLAEALKRIAELDKFGGYNTACDIARKALPSTASEKDKA